MSKSTGTSIITSKTVIMSIVLFAIVIGVSIIRTKNEAVNNKESFIPMINSMYKPRVRQVRNYFTQKWNSLNNNIHYILKKYRFI
jgi:L-cystine uptake protein TcyP (sodium:dicarboxylate symporter family)